jgi:phage terminase large subunit-like protein
MPAKTAIRTWPDTVPKESRTLGWAVLAWMADYLTQPDGPDAGQPLRLTREQVRILLRWYAIDARGRFLYRRGVLRRAKGWGKSPFLAALACAELCGPVRFQRFGSDRLPVVVQHPAPWIQVAATSREQTRNTMTVFPGMFSAEAIDTHKIDIGKEIIYARGGGRIEAVTSSPRALEGGRPSLVIADETSHWVQANAGHEMAQAIRRNAGKSRDGAARAMEITNAHLVGEESVAETTHDAAQAAEWRLDGVYYDSLEAPAVPDLSDLDAVRAAVVAAAGDSTWIDADRIVGEIADPATPASVARRYYFNQVVEADTEEWLPAGSWEACERPGGIEPHATIVVGFDGSFSGDSTAVIGVSTAAPPHIDVLGCWERPEHAPADWRVDILDVEERLRQIAKEYNVVEITADPYRWSRSLEVLRDEGLPVTEFPQTSVRMVPATQRFAEAVSNRQLTHSGDRRLNRHLANAVLRIDSRGPRLSKPTKWSPRKIDLAVAAVMALERAAHAKPRSRPRIISLQSLVDEMDAEER